MVLLSTASGNNPKCLLHLIDNPFLRPYISCVGIYVARCFAHMRRHTLDIFFFILTPLVCSSYPAFALPRCVCMFGHIYCSWGQQTKYMVPHNRRSLTTCRGRCTARRATTRRPSPTSWSPTRPSTRRRICGRCDRSRFVLFCFVICLPSFIQGWRSFAVFGRSRFAPTQMAIPFAAHLCTNGFGARRFVGAPECLGGVPGRLEL